MAVPPIPLRRNGEPAVAGADDAGETCRDRSRRTRCRPTASRVHALAATEAEPERTLDVQPPNTTGLDGERCRESLALVEDHLDAVGVDFYAQLFTIALESRELFGAGMAVQRSRLSARSVSTSAAPTTARPSSRTSRAWAATTASSASSTSTTARSARRWSWPSGGRWRPAGFPRFESAWIEAYDRIAAIMVGAARRDAVISPPWWDAEVVYHAHPRRPRDHAGPPAHRLPVPAGPVHLPTTPRRAKI